jgi:hypothetical protein
MPKIRVGLTIYFSVLLPRITMMRGRKLDELWKKAK